MSEVDRLSTSGTYPALPMAAKRRAQEDSPHPDAQEKRSDGRPSHDGQDAGNQSGPPPKSPTSLIDEYA
jgi:hypothetical protein